MRIGTASAEPGEKAFGFLKVGNRPDGSDLGFPVIIVNGSEKGPVLLADGVHHGDEPLGCEAVLRFAKELEPNKLKGTFIGVPVLNVEAFQARSRISPVDFQDMNRMYPGEGTAFLSSKIAFAYLNEVVLKSNYLITCHAAGTFHGSMSHVIALAWEESETCKKSIEMAKAFGLNFRKSTRASFDSYLPAHSMRKGIPTILVECGSMTDVYTNRRHFVDLMIRGFRNVAKYLKMLEGKPVLPPKQLIISGTIRGKKQLIMRSKCGGLWIPEKKQWDVVTKGALLGRIVSPFNIDDELECIVAPHDGIVLGIWAHPVIYPREGTVAFGEVIKEIKNV